MRPKVLFYARSVDLHQIGVEIFYLCLFFCPLINLFYTFVFVDWVFFTILSNFS
jgi:hypothetical protein